MTVALAANPGNATLGGTLTVTASGGIATLSGLTLDTAASGYTLIASSSGVDSVTTSAITVKPASASQLVITQQPPDNVIVGSGFGMQATIEDAYNNVEATDDAVVSVMLANNPDSASLGGMLIVTATNGVASFSGLTLDQTGAGDTLAVSSNGLTDATSNPITAIPIPAQKLVITEQPPTSVAAGASFGLTVQAEDNANALATTFIGTVTVMIANEPDEQLSGTLTTTASNGIASFSGLELTRAASAYTIFIWSNGLSGATTNPITVTPAAASQVVIAEQPPESVTAGSTFGLQATIEDPYDNVETGDSTPLTVTLASNPPGSTLSGTLSAAPFEGVADFSALTLTTAASGYTLQVAAGLLSTTTSAIDVSPAAATNMIVATAPPDSFSAGTPFGLTVDVEDSYGNLAPLSGDLSVSIGSGPAGATLGGQADATDEDGAATFSGLALTRAGSYVLLVSGGDLPRLTIYPITVTPGETRTLVVTGQPNGDVIAGSGFDLTVQAEDTYGNPTPAFTGPVTVSIEITPENPTLGERRLLPA